MSVWGTAVWGADRWPALTVAEALQQPPSITNGVPIGVGDWRLCVEVLLPEDMLAIWGIATWGEVDWTQYVWYDLTPWCRGVEWQRGSDEPYGRPRIGTLSMTLDSRNAEFSPWSTPTNISGLDMGGEPILTHGRLSPGWSSPSWWSPGTLVRVALRSATDTRARGWLPQYCGIVDSWVTDYATSNLADQFATVTAVETLRDLSQIDDNALPGVVGGGEGAGERMERLLEAAGWPYGLLIEAQNIAVDPTNYPLQSTDMAANRLTECYLVADSCDTHFRTDRTGAAIMTNVEYIGVIGDADPDLLPLVEFSYYLSLTTPLLGFHRAASDSGDVLYVGYRPESFKSATSDENVVNDCRFAIVGGTQQTYEQAASIARFGRRTLVRNDFPNTTDPPVALIAEYVSERRALNALRVDLLTVDLDRCGDDYALAVLAADVGSRAFVYPPTDPGTIGGFIRSMTHKVTPRNAGEVTWEASFAFDTRTVFNIPGAQLPAS